MFTAHADVERMLEEGVPFERIEAYIEARRDLPEDFRGILWMLAWAETTPQHRRMAIRTQLDQHLALVID